MNTYNFDGLKRVNKTAARHLFNNGKTIRLCACRINPTNIYGLYFDTAKDIDDDDFDKLVNSFEYYNCNSETGYYTAFYVHEK